MINPACRRPRASIDHVCLLGKSHSSNPNSNLERSTGSSNGGAFLLRFLARKSLLNIKKVSEIIQRWQMTRQRLLPRLRFPVIFGVLPIFYLFFADPLSAQVLPAFDFRNGEVSHEWQAIHNVSGLRQASEGLKIDISGADPYVYGPVRNYPENQFLWLDIRVKSDEAGFGQVFYFSDPKNASEANSVRFAVPERRKWVDVRIPLPPLGPQIRLRIDPPGVRGTCIIASLKFEPRYLPKEPAWPKPVTEALRDDVLILQSGDVKLLHSRGSFGGFAINVAGHRMAGGSANQLIGYERHGKVAWLNLAEGRSQSVSKASEKIVSRVKLTDADGVEWTIDQLFSPGAMNGTINVETHLVVSEDRDVVFFPLFFIFPGVGSFGEKRGQALFAGVEYLDAPDDSSSEADIVGPESRRQLPDFRKNTFPLMAVQADERYIGLIWDRKPEFGAFFDSPDRRFASGGHAMGVVFPGSDGSNRPEGSLLPYNSTRLPGGKSLVFKAVVIGGKGESVVPAVKKYVDLRGVPELVADAGIRRAYLEESVRGWLESSIGKHGLFSHAYWPGNSSFPPQPAADAAVFMKWLARSTADSSAAMRLEAAAEEAISRVKPTDFNESNIAHVTFPVASLLYGHVAENAEQALVRGRKLLSRFERDGSVRYKAHPAGPNLGKTHFVNEANGLTAQLVLQVLECAAVSGDPVLLREGERLLRALDKFADSVPRGAQTWEIPLHAPDILAAAWLVRAYTLGYELTGDSRCLELAKYWAWTGVPFVYLENPNARPIGLFATIAVLGATEWTAPVWIGLPVQWCGLVYADALYRLMRHDTADAAFWKRLADGITLSGMQQLFPDGEGRELRGLLPDSFNLQYQLRNGPAVNPGTLQADAVRLLGGPLLYDFRVFRNQGVTVHAPGTIEVDAEADQRSVSFTLQGWSTSPYYILMTGVKAEPSVLVNGEKVSLSPPHFYDAKNGRLILRLEGSPKVTISGV